MTDQRSTGDPPSLTAPGSATGAAVATGATDSRPFDRRTRLPGATSVAVASPRATPSTRSTAARSGVRGRRRVTSGEWPVGPADPGRRPRRRRRTGRSRGAGSRAGTLGPQQPGLAGEDRDDVGRPPPSTTGGARGGPGCAGTGDRRSTDRERHRPSPWHRAPVLGAPQSQNRRAGVRVPCRPTPSRPAPRRRLSRTVSA